MIKFVFNLMHNHDGYQESRLQYQRHSLVDITRRRDLKLKLIKLESDIKSLCRRHDAQDLTNRDFYVCLILILYYY